ncbi:DUF4974 domain-containing protein [Mucilaginibacter robiniae]|uniref:DUF4974 domain-containing protein n=1 Tax=Mucilaginibacter robiniae TaxID=2728022 RepID=A0A7L5DYE3_9SPHI|nr:FecR domain-containing protein [Mucilaginibacter robiniae]QJD95228.1 DUF4974 domain-containing protein [Mucilaginibacter robiniae]
MNWEILLKYINKEATAAEYKQVERWLQAQTENQHLLQYLSRRQEQLNAPLKQEHIHEQWVRLVDRILEVSPSNNRVKSIKPYRFIGLAASLLLLSVLGLLYVQQPPVKSKLENFTLQTPAYQRGQVTLPDGTQIYLAPNTHIAYNSDFGKAKRELHLVGEAFFKVKHNPHKPFIVYTGSKVSVTVLGTAFNVYARQSAAAEVKVATGLVGVKYRNRTQLLKPGQQLSFTANSSVATIQPVLVKDASSLQSETLIFNNSNATEIAEKLQRWYNVQVTLSASAHNASRFSGEIKDDGIGSTLQAISYATGLHYHYKNSHTLTLF